MSQQIVNGADVEATLRARFEQLREQWEEATGILSNPDRRAAHPAHQAVIALGMPVVPLLLRDMEARYTHWFMALRAITGENPVRREHAGRVPLMVEDWLAWGRQRKLI
jgi:hypothetical protein